MKKIIQLFVIIPFLLASNSLFSQSLSLVADINSGAGNSFPAYLTEFNNKIHFVAGNGTGFKLYSSNGTLAGTTLIGPTINANGVVWHLTKYNNKLFFMYDDGINGLELWTSDGTTAGTVLLKDIYPGSLGSQPEKFTICNGLLFFVASSPTRSQGLWVTDGTAVGTQMLGNQYSNPFSSGYTFVVLNNKIYFQGNTGSGYGMWESNGTTVGTQLVKAGIIGASGGSYAVLNNNIYFQSGDNVNGNELWKSDGTSTGTVLIKNIYSGIQGSSPDDFFSDGKKVYFTANDSTMGKELWVTDGTTSGTQLVKDVQAGVASSDPKTVMKFNNEVYFFARNGSNIDVLKTNGTLAGTTLIKSIPNLASVVYSYEFNGKFYFVASMSIGGAGYLYESNGTTIGTNRITPVINTYPSNTMQFNFLDYNNEIYLPAYYGSQGNEFCKLTPLPLGLNQYDLTNVISVYPNPATNVIQLQLNGATFSTITFKLLDVTGKEIVNQLIQSNNTQIDVNQYAKGLYFYQLIKEGEKHVGKLILQ